MRNRITVRGKGIELRGYIDAEHGYEIERLFADDLNERAVIIASIAAENYDPFRITEPEFEPQIEASREIIRSIMGADIDAGQVMESLASLHFQQAYVIRGERHRAEVAEIVLGEIIEKAIALVDDVALGQSNFANAARESAKAALRQVAIDLAAEAGPPRG